MNCILLQNSRPVPNHIMKLCNGLSHCYISEINVESISYGLVMKLDADFDNNLLDEQSTEYEELSTSVEHTVLYKL